MDGRGAPVDFKEAIRYQKMAVECLRKKVSNIEDWDISVSDYKRYQESTRDEREEVLKSIGRFQTWLRAADTTCPEACFLVGKCYNMGILTSKNSQRARSYYLKGAKHGDAFCQANYGSMMRELEWYEIAAHGGSYAGAYNAANHYDGENSQKERYYRRLVKR
ncbi:MAG: hypothetical protein QF416_02220, partial [Candidatus Marinimicrobia bacterium]|nr:hypothetical protein [Candidatus Neomarinimicrobiota bacterium]